MYFTSIFYYCLTLYFISFLRKELDALKLYVSTKSSNYIQIIHIAKAMNAHNAYKGEQIWKSMNPIVKVNYMKNKFYLLIFFIFYNLLLASIFNFENERIYIVKIGGGSRT